MKPIRLSAFVAVIGVGSLSLALLVSTGTANAATTTYFVSPSGSDTNSGTSAAQPFKTVQKAADSTAPGDVVQLMNGTYEDPGTGRDIVNITRSGTPEAPITYEAHPGHKPVLHPVSGWHGIRITGASHIKISGLEVAGNSENVDLAQAKQEAGKKKPVFNTNCIGAYKDEKTGKASTHLEITGNHVHHCPGGGISAIDADHVTIDRNRVHSTSWYTEYATSGISILRALDAGKGDPSQYKIRITGNMVYDNETKVIWTETGKHSDGNGIIIDTLKGKDNKDPDYRGRVLVANNVSFDNGGSGIHSFRAHHVDIVNNTAYQNGRSPNMDPYANIFAAKSSDVRILNNVSVVSGGKPTNSTHENTDVTYDYNIYSGGKKPEATGPHDMVVDPKLVKPGTDPSSADFRLAEGSPAIDSGTAFDLPGTDVAGNARKAGAAPDRGAFEFGAGPAEGAGEAAAALAVPQEAESTPIIEPTASSDQQATSTTGTTSPARTTEAIASSDAGSGGGLASTGASVIGLVIGGVVVVGGGVLALFLVRRKRAKVS